MECPVDVIEIIVLAASNGFPGSEHYTAIAVGCGFDLVWVELRISVVVEGESEATPVELLKQCEVVSLVKFV